MLKIIVISVVLFLSSITSSKASLVEYTNQDFNDYSIAISTNYILIDSSEIFYHLGDKIYKNDFLSNGEKIHFDGKYIWSLHFDLIGTSVIVTPLLGKSDKDNSKLINWAENPYGIKESTLYFELPKPKSDLPAVPLPSAIWLMIAGLITIFGFSKNK